MKQLEANKIMRVSRANKRVNKITQGFIEESSYQTSTLSTQATLNLNQHLNFQDTTTEFATLTLILFGFPCSAQIFIFKYC